MSGLKDDAFGCISFRLMYLEQQVLLSVWPLLHHAASYSYVESNRHQHVFGTQKSLNARIPSNSNTDTASARYPGENPPFFQWLLVGCSLTCSAACARLCIRGHSYMASSSTFSSYGQVRWNMHILVEILNGRIARKVEMWG